jgi:hypothetical protein
LEIALGMLELDYALENDKLEAPAVGVDGFDELMVIRAIDFFFASAHL